MLKFLENVNDEFKVLLSVITICAVTFIVIVTIVCIESSYISNEQLRNVKTIKYDGAGRVLEIEKYDALTK